MRMTWGASHGRLRAGAVLMAAVAVLAVGGCDDETGDAPLPERITASPGPASPGSRAAEEADCPVSGVRVGTGMTEAAMGLRAMGLTLHNCGTRPFEVSGYPALDVLGEEREKLDVTVVRGSDVDTTTKPSVFVLAPGARATASVVWRNTVTRTDVVATNGAYVRVTPAPGAAAQTAAPQDGGPLDLGNTGRVEVTPWRPAQDR
ncbi:DUF4232 domain-containing protein [Streptomyces ficellus]|uniref:DUF4232 domain-containing protein n=1 Tax=Streptomyces ficellus TaxID=1977088 RepID=A0A6I6F932_9ACTN|nr:DUF4232 domain-containing protein [Streptomyces ficellus]QGV79434.1 DUF4232 domain-containing protein [Streptomyces ficellus]